MFDNHILSLSIWVPILAGILVLATGDDQNARLSRWTAGWNWAKTRWATC